MTILGPIYPISNIRHLWLNPPTPCVIQDHLLANPPPPPILVDVISEWPLIILSSAELLNYIWGFSVSVSQVSVKKGNRITFTFIGHLKVP